MADPRKLEVSFVPTFAEAEGADRAYYWALTTQQRWSLMETLRRCNDGDRATGRLLFLVHCL